MPYVTAFYAALIGLLCVLLSILVVRLRMQSRISIGDGGDKTLARMTRVFGNFAEYATLALVLLTLIELCGGSRLLLHLFGVSFVIGRIAHAVGLGRSLGINFGRSAGVVLTSLVIFGSAVTLLLLAVPKLF